MKKKNSVSIDERIFLILNHILVCCFLFCEIIL
jgi:hypothetical protein